MIRKTLNGVITKKSGEKTYRVEVSFQRKHPLYRKIVAYKRSYLAHAELDHEIDEEVTIVASGRRLSKRKAFIVVEDNNKVESK